MSDIIVGIDLGTTNSAVAVVEDGKPRILPKGEERIIPSVVGYSESSGWLVGRPALNQYTLDPENTVRSIKRKMGDQEQVKIGNRALTPQEISAFILRELKAIAEENLGQPISKAVITVPAYFTNAQREATKEAGEIAGLEVVRIINEPTAAALAYGLDREDDQIALVYDLGGGTFDVSLVEMTGGVVEVLASHGDTQLGGDDFDHLLAEQSSQHFQQEHQIQLQDNRRAMARLDRAAEAAKVRLTDFPQAVMREEYLTEKDSIPLHLDLTILRTEFEEMTQDLLKRTTESLNKVLADAELEIDDLDRILLVGGSTRMPMVWEMVSDFTQLDPDAEINPDEVVALGAAVQGAIIAGQPVDSILVDVTPYSLGIESATWIGGQVIPDIFSILIRRNTAIPVTKEELFKTLHPDQDTVEIKVYQGEELTASANSLLGDFVIKGLKPAHPGEHPSVSVRFDFDVNGILRVSANNPESGSEGRLEVQATQARLTPTQIAEARERLYDQIATAVDGDDEATASITVDQETQVLLNRAQTLLEGDTLTAEQTAELKALANEFDQVESQEALDDLSEELLDMLFDLE